MLTFEEKCRLANIKQRVIVFGKKHVSREDHQFVIDVAKRLGIEITEEQRRQAISEGYCV